MKITSIQTRLLLILLPFFILTFGVLSGVSYYLSNQELTKSLDDTATAVGTDYANRIETAMQENMLQLEDIANIPVMRAGSDRDQIVATLADAFKRFGKFDQMNFIWLDGNSVRSDGSTVNLASRDQFKKVMETKKPYITHPMPSLQNGNISMVLAVPVFNNGQLSGILTATYPLEKMTELVKGVKFKDSGYGFVCSDNGLLVMDAAQPQLIGKLDFSKKQTNPDLKLADAELDDSLMNLVKAGTAKQLMGQYTFGGIKRVGVFTPINLPGGQHWVMAVTAPADEVFRATGRLAKTMLAVSLVFLVLAVVFIIVLSKRFAQPIQIIRDACLLLTQGDFRERENQIRSEDEIGQLAKGFQAMRTNLRALVTSVQSQAEQVAAASEELTAGAQQSADAANQVAGSISDIADGTKKQAASASQGTAVAQQMSVSTEQVSSAASEVSVIAGKTSQVAETGRQAVEQAVENMRQIGQGSEAVQTAITELAKGSQEISEIVNLISTIAGQTNLLALNAAIEAARAGEHGRGFAVVAEEVRKLAEESNQAAHQIGSLIQRNQTNMEQAVVATQAGAEGIKAGIAVVNSAGETFKNIVESIVELSEQIKAISGSINQMAAGSRTMVLSIQEIDKVSKENAAEAQTVAAATEEQSASMEEIASSSQNLARLAGALQEAVAKFRV
ncbi:MAG: methyl-accepting chemotaxis protein [Negativicutes bacterium]|nr:methyl-accepting chemotaxis protein [Negativicutes bacterium]